MAGAARMQKLTMPVDLSKYEPPTELRVNAKKFKGFSEHRVGDKIRFSGHAEVHHVSEGENHHEVTLHIRKLSKGE